ncbi:hypothetical protein [Collinsella intestinalis]|uniref:hypothetical protein n=1 Tax=Collinsella intestinalis TaxID=147207 RepID=UPI00241CDC3C|nr:hypothetical protein [Collinsella intestinalis]
MVIALLFVLGVIVVFALRCSELSPEGNFIPPARGDGTLRSVSEGMFVIQVELGDSEAPLESFDIAHNATEDGCIVLAVRDDAMERRLATEFEVGELVYVEYPMTTGVKSDNGQITCSLIRSAG